jgi:RNA polymerase sigma factor (sigma-70 family)
VDSDQKNEANPSRNLLHAAQKGDREAQEALLELHLPRLRAFVRLRADPALRAKESSTDILQSTCREVLQHLDQVEYRSEAALRGWLHTVTLNKVREKRRYHFAEKRRPDYEVQGARDSQLGDAYSCLYSPSNAMIHDELVERMELAFDELSPDHREVISLSRIAELPLKEVAERMKRSPDGVRKLLARALVKLSAILEPGDALPGK